MPSSLHGTMDADNISRMIKNHTGNLYLVIDPKPGLKSVLPKVTSALEGGVDMLQLWNNWSTDESPTEFINAICDLAHHYRVPVFIHEHWKWLNDFPLDGVHFDSVPFDIDKIRSYVNRTFFCGITCNNDENKILWAVDHQFDYISFCSMYPSSTANSCGLVRFEIVKKICEQRTTKVFVAGGITTSNLSSVLSLGIHGIAIVSGIMSADDPEQAARTFKHLLNQPTHSTFIQ